MVSIIIYIQIIKGFRVMRKVMEKRLQKGWTQTELADRSGVSQSTISQIESGKREYPNVFNIRKIAKALEISIEELMPEDDSN